MLQLLLVLLSLSLYLISLFQGVCRMLDDGTFMVGCEGCDVCWIHPGCFLLCLLSILLCLFICLFIYCFLLSFFSIYIYIIYWLTHCNLECIGINVTPEMEVIKSFVLSPPVIKHNWEWIIRLILPPSRLFCVLWIAR